MIRRCVENPSLPKRSSIRRSTREDLEAIHRWMLEEEAKKVHGNFLCNWSMIESAQKDGELLVYVDGQTGTPVGFQIGKLVRPGILQVRNSYRRRSIGRKLVERCFYLARKSDECLLYIQCKPSSSIPFWRKMGFTLLESTDGKNYAYQVLDKLLPLPEHGSDIEVTITFFPESRKWQSSTPSYAINSPQARITADGIVHLRQRVLFHECAYRESHDVVIGIQVAEKLFYRDKAKYPEAERIGVTRCKNGFYIDRIHTTKAGFNDNC